MYTTIFFCFASSIVRFPIKHHLHANGQLIACNLFESIGTRRNEKQMLVCPALRLCPCIIESLKTEVNRLHDDPMPQRIQLLFANYVPQEICRNYYLLSCHIRRILCYFRCRHADASVVPPPGKLHANQRKKKCI